MIAYFGKERDFYLYPVSEVEETHSLPTNHLGAYLYSTKPSIEDARAGDGSPVATIAPGAFVETEDELGKKITIPQIEDPNPNQVRDSGTVYYLAVNFKVDANDASAQPVTLVRQITYYRLRVQSGALLIDVEDLTKAEPMISVLFSNCLGDINHYIDSALQEIKTLLSSTDFTWGDIITPEPIKKAVIHLALADFLAGSTEGTVQDNLKKKHEKKYQLFFKNIKIETDANQDGTAEKRKTSFMRSIRFGQ